MNYISCLDLSPGIALKSIQDCVIQLSMQEVVFGAQISIETFLLFFRDIIIQHSLREGLVQADSLREALRQPIHRKKERFFLLFTHIRVKQLVWFFPTSTINQPSTCLKEEKKKEIAYWHFFFFVNMNCQSKRQKKRKKKTQNKQFWPLNIKILSSSLAQIYCFHVDAIFRLL